MSGEKEEMREDSLSGIKAGENRPCVFLDEILVMMASRNLLEAPVDLLSRAGGATTKGLFSVLLCTKSRALAPC
jgi:hypothetical protein